MPVVRDLIFSPCGGIGGPLGPLVYEYYDEGFDNRKNPNVIVQRTDWGALWAPHSVLCTITFGFRTIVKTFIIILINEGA